MAEPTHRTLLEMDQFVHACCLRVRSRCTDDVPVNVVALDIRLDRKIHKIVRLVHRIIPAFSRDQMFPVLGEEFPVHARRHIRCDHRRLDREGSASAERIHEDPVALPRSQHDECRRQRLRDRRLTCQGPVTALMQGFSGRVKRYRHRVLVKEYAQREACTALREPFDPICLFHPLDHGFFHDGLDIGRAEELALNGGSFRDPEFRILREIFLPRDRAGPLEQFLESLCMETADL